MENASSLIKSSTIFLIIQSVICQKNIIQVNMPDQKRINGPENSQPYRLYSKLNSRTYTEKLAEQFTESNLRKDGRKFDESRKICN